MKKITLKLFIKIVQILHRRLKRSAEHQRKPKESDKKNFNIPSREIHPRIERKVTASTFKNRKVEMKFRAFAIFYWEKS